MLKNRFVLYGIIFLSGLAIAVAFMALNTSYSSYFWPMLIVFTTLFLLSIRSVIREW